MRFLVFSLLLVCGACGSSDSQPSPPTENDPRFSVQVQRFLLAGDDLTPATTEMYVSVEAFPGGTTKVRGWLDSTPFDFTKDNEVFTGALNVEALPVGSYELLLSANGSDKAFAAFTVQKTHPYYVVLSTDWDDADSTDQSLAYQDALHDEHPGLLITHFVGPYTFTDPDLTPERVTLLADWVKSMKSEYEDEIGLHIHPYCHFVEEAGLECKTSPSTVYFNGDSSGYTVLCAAYSQPEFETLLAKSDELFMANGFGKPTSFRAGGWTADASTLKALYAKGYVADTSANNWGRMEEWEGVLNGVLYNWNKDTWSEIGDTSQPYYPTEEDIQSNQGTPIGILEVPDNGIMADYVSTEEMIEIFWANWDGTPLSAPVALSIGYHPAPEFREEYYERIDEMLTFLDDHLAVNGDGPVVYARLSDLANVWK